MIITHFPTCHAISLKSRLPNIGGAYARQLVFYRKTSLRSMGIRVLSCVNYSGRYTVKFSKIPRQLPARHVWDVRVPSQPYSHIVLSYVNKWKLIQIYLTNMHWKMLKRNLFAVEVMFKSNGLPIKES